MNKHRGKEKVTKKANYQPVPKHAQELFPQTALTEGVIMECPLGLLV